VKLSKGQIEFACEKREAGWSTSRIAKHLGVSSGAINYQCLKHGAVSPHQRATATPETRTVYKGKDGRTFRTFTPDEDDRIMALATEGKSAREIATIMDRARTSIMMRIMLLELREEKL
jgi:IS30 family transposase